MADSSSNFRVSLFSNFFLVSGILIALTGVITPLGLSEGELTPFGRKVNVNAVYIADTSPVALATSPGDGYEFSRICGAFRPTPRKRRQWQYVGDRTIHHEDLLQHPPWTLQHAISSLF
jgi:hypothetical protein